MTKIEYEKDAKIIYEQSFSIARQEADLKGFNEKEAKVATRIAHASGMPHVTSHLRFTSGAISAGISAILKGAPIICDCNMVKAGISMTDKLPGNELLCFLNHPEVANIAKHQKTTRSRAPPARGRCPLCLGVLLLRCAQGPCLSLCSRCDRRKPPYLDAIIPPNVHPLQPEPVPMPQE